MLFNALVIKKYINFLKYISPKQFFAAVSIYKQISCLEPIFFILPLKFSFPSRLGKKNNKVVKINQKETWMVNDERD